MKNETTTTTFADLAIGRRFQIAGSDPQPPVFSLMKAEPVTKFPWETPCDGCKTPGPEVWNTRQILDGNEPYMVHVCPYKEITPMPPQAQQIERWEAQLKSLRGKLIYTHRVPARQAVLDQIGAILPKLADLKEDQASYAEELAVGDLIAANAEWERNHLEAS